MPRKKKALKSGELSSSEDINPEDLVASELAEAFTYFARGLRPDIDPGATWDLLYTVLQEGLTPEEFEDIGVLVSSTWDPKLKPPTN